MALSDALYKKVMALLAQASELLTQKEPMTPMRLYEAAFSLLGMDASPQDIVPDEFGCAETLSRVVQKAFPDLKFPTLLSTREMYSHLTRSPSFEEVDEPIYGDIIISVTGLGNGSVPNGHCGVVGRHLAPNGSLWIMSNDSRSGTWEANYSIEGWRRFFETRGGMKTHYFRVF